jgi:hypothetical protein
VEARFSKEVLWGLKSITTETNVVTYNVEVQVLYLNVVLSDEVQVCQTAM